MLVRRLHLRSAAWPVAATAVFTGLCWKLFGVTVHDGVLFGLYVLGFDLLPGCALYVALLRPPRFGIRELAIGWGLGYAIEVLAFAATASLGMRDLFALYPAAVLAITAPAWGPAVRRWLRPPPLDAWWAWGLALVVIAAVSYAVEGFFTVSPLPWQMSVVSYYADTVWNVAMAGEALHRWPPQVPSVAGVPLRYHIFADIHAAGVTQVTGIPLATVMLRLYLVPMLILVAIQFVGLARALRASAGAGVAAAALLLLASRADPAPGPPSEILSTFFFSPSFLYGMVVFLALATLICDRMAGAADDGRPWGAAAVGLLLMAGCAGGKTTILPVVLGGALLGLVFWRARPLPALSPRILLATAGAAAAVFGLFSVTMYAGGSNSLEIDVLGHVRSEQPFDLLHDKLGGSLVARAAIDAAAGALGLLKLLLVLLPGIAVLVVRRQLDGPRALLLAMLVASVAPILVLTHPGDSQLYFFYYGFAAAAAVSGVGLAVLIGPLLAGVCWRPRWIVATGVALVLAALVESPFDYTPRKAWQALDGEITYSQENANLTRPLYEGMRWVAGNTPTSAVVAVNNRFQNAARTDARYCYFTAFTERRAMLECGYDGTSTDYGSLAGDRTRIELNDRIFAHGDRTALGRAVREYGVRFLLVDRVHGPVDERVLRLGRVVFSNGALTVVRV